MLDKKYLLSAGMGAVLLASVGGGMLALADTTTSGTPTATAAMMARAGKPGVFGTVTAVSGNTITVSMTNPKDKTTKTYTIDASAAAITKDMTVTASDIKVGDTLMAAGTVTGTSVAATTIHDGKMPMPPMGMGGMMGHRGMGRANDNDADDVKTTSVTPAPTTSQ